MTTGACKIRRGCNVLQVPVQIIPLGVPKLGRYPPPWLIKIVKAFLRIIRWDESQNVENSPLRINIKIAHQHPGSSPTLNPTQLIGSNLIFMNYLLAQCS